MKYESSPEKLVVKSRTFFSSSLRSGRFQDAVAVLVVVSSGLAIKKKKCMGRAERGENKQKKYKKRR
jgi:hypothetical protein